jgi:excisionase family DNA binding protein
MALSLELYTELLTTLKLDGHTRLAERLKSEVEVNEDLTSTQAAQLLGVSSANTVKNWMEGGFFPSAYKTAGGHWRFPRAEVEAVREEMKALREKNSSGDIALEYDPTLDYGDPPLL